MLPLDPRAPMLGVLEADLGNPSNGFRSVFNRYCIVYVIPLMN
jgi:hypothetical protein